MEFLAPNNPHLSSFVKVDPESDFPIQNLPFGVMKTKDGSRVVSAIGTYVVDLYELAKLGYLDNVGIEKEMYRSEFLNAVISCGKEKTRKLRRALSTVLQVNSKAEKDKDIFLKPMSKVKLTMPIKVGDYTDFYSSIEHATNVGTMFRGSDNALKPNWKHLPVGYHGRASSIVISGTNLHRPVGQKKPVENEGNPRFGPSERMDFELEVAFVIGKENGLGNRIDVHEAEDYIFGLTMFNDWSARDIQAWEYVPLGPFLGKSFGSTLSPWIVTLDALEPFRVESYPQDIEVLEYLKGSDKASFDLRLEVDIRPEGKEATTICISNFKYMYWTMAQQLAHHTVNGCNMKVGDVCASGTISGKTRSSYGSMLELSWSGKNEIELKGGDKRTFIEDNDTITLRGYGLKDGIRIGFGDCVGKVLPAK